jgi:hypothetical protein
VIARAYGVALLLFPPAFRAAFGDCMAADFDDGLRDARRATRPWFFVGWLGRVAWDLGRSIAWQWWRTGVPILTTAYAGAIMVVCEGLSSIMLRSLWPAAAPSNPSDGTAVVATTGAVIMVSVLTFVLWFVLPNLRRDTPRSIRA